MVQFDENDLLYKDYNNIIGNIPDYIEIEDLIILDIKEHYHVIYFCDYYLKRYRLDKDVENFQKVESIIRMNPDQFCDKQQLFKFVFNNWNLVLEKA